MQTTSKHDQAENKNLNYTLFQVNERMAGDTRQDYRLNSVPVEREAVLPHAPDMNGLRATVCPNIEMTPIVKLNRGNVSPTVYSLKEWIQTELATTSTTGALAAEGILPDRVRALRAEKKKYQDADKSIHLPVLFFVPGQKRGRNNIYMEEVDVWQPDGTYKRMMLRWDGHWDVPVHTDLFYSLRCFIAMLLALPEHVRETKK